MAFKFVCSLCVIFLVNSQCLAAEFSAASKREVEALLQSLADSGCQFNRNGSWYSGNEAKAHLTRKLAYVIEHQQATSTEEFIQVAATKSSMSGLAYLVRCQDQVVTPSAFWLSATLKRLRAK
ncbi:MAG: DUF5329 domain-containing protein [Undibacterium sp.]|nr:DUF5329 domain-containing protein [Undibacterium sp.]